MNLSSRDQALIFQVIDALTSSLKLPEVLSRTWEVLPQLLSADYMALCISKPGRPAEYDWMATGGSSTLLAQYGELAAEDFVRKAVMRHPNMVLRDTEMLPRRELEGSLLYQRSRELNLALEQVMAVMLNVSPEWHGGLTLYRDRRRPFSQRDRDLLQLLTPYLGRAVVNCRMMDEAATGSYLLDELHRRQGAAYLVLSPPSLEKMRTPRASVLLEKWFSRSDYGSSGLPRALVERLQLLTGPGAATKLGADTWLSSREDESLMVKFVPLPEQGGSQRWALVFHEFSHAIHLPVEMRRELTPREIEIANCVLRNWSNEDIAYRLRVTLGTAKTHVRNVFKKLMVDNRADLMYQAARFLKPV